MDLRQLRYFTAAAETGSISRAAERCGVAQPSLSQQVRRLEAALGVTLFDRLGRGVALTPAGHALLPRAKRILAEVHDAETNLGRDVDEGSGRLSVGAIPTMAPYLLPAPLAVLRSAFPRCELAVREDLTEHLLDALAGNEIDVAVVSTPIEHELVELEVLGSEPLLAVVPAGHDLADGDGVTLEELRPQPTITLHEMHCLGRQISGFCSARRLGGNVVCRTTQLSTVLEFVRQGLGVSLVPEMAALDDDCPERRYLPIRRHAPRRDIALAWRSGRSRAVTARRLADELSKRLATPPPRR